MFTSSLFHREDSFEIHEQVRKIARYWKSMKEQIVFDVECAVKDLNFTVLTSIFANAIFIAGKTNAVCFLVWTYI